MGGLSDILKFKGSRGNIELKLDLDKADSLLEKDEMIPFGIKLSEVQGYLPGVAPFDQFQGVGDYYRRMMREHSQLIAIRESYLRELLRNAPEGSFECLTVESKEERESKNFYGKNEAVLVDGWVFPAYMVEGAAIRQKGQRTITLEVMRGDNLLRELRYYANQHGALSYGEPHLAAEMAGRKGCLFSLFS